MSTTKCYGINSGKFLNFHCCNECFEDRRTILPNWYWLFCVDFYFFTKSIQFFTRFTMQQPTGDATKILIEYTEIDASYLTCIKCTALVAEIDDIINCVAIHKLAGMDGVRAYLNSINFKEMY